MDTPPLRFGRMGECSGRIAAGQTALGKSDVLITDIVGESKALETKADQTYPPRGGGDEFINA